MISQPSYIYSASRVNALIGALPTRSDYERLLAAASDVEMLTILRDTLFGEVVSSVSSQGLDAVLESTLTQVKQLLLQIAPKDDPLRFLWIQYDIHNLRLFAKAHASNVPWSTLQTYVSERGLYKPAYLYDHVTTGTLNRLEVGWQEAFVYMTTCCQQGDIQKADALADSLLFRAMKVELALMKHQSIRGYVERFIDMYNIKNRLRSLAIAPNTSLPEGMPGGFTSLQKLESKEAIYAVLQQLAGDGWRDAIDFLDVTGNTSRFDARADEYLLSVARQGAYTTFSAASLLTYYLLCRQAVTNIRLIASAKKSGMSVAEVRTNLRLAYVNN